MDDTETSQCTTEEEDNLGRSTKRKKVNEATETQQRTTDEGCYPCPSYKDSLYGGVCNTQMDVDLSDDDSEVSEDDLSEDEVEGPMFSMGMSRQEKIIARRPWQTSLIVMSIGRKIGLAIPTQTPSKHVENQIPIHVY